MTITFKKWVSSLRDNTAKAAIATRVIRIQEGLLGDVKSVGGNIYEARIFISKGYRLYFTIKNNKIVMLLCGGHKGTQANDIKQAKAILQQLENEND